MKTKAEHGTSATRVVLIIALRFKKYTSGVVLCCDVLQAQNARTPSDRPSRNLSNTVDQQMARARASLYL